MWNLKVICLILAGIWIQTGFASSVLPLEKREADCKHYLIQGNDTCPRIAKANKISTADIETYNARTFAWRGCGRLRQGDFICLGPGEPPWPAALPNAVCGPQVPGTVRPVGIVDWPKIGLMNPCPPGQCCTSNGLCSPLAGSCKEVAGRSTSTTTVNGITVKPTTLKTSKTTTSKKTMTTTTSKKNTTTTKKKTTTTTSKKSEETGNLWSIAIYNKPNCEGDYYVVQGHSAHANNKCLGIHSGISSEDTGTNTWCRRYTDGGFKNTNCDKGPIHEVKSWHITSGICTVYDSETCESNGLSQAYASWIKPGCRNSDKWTPKQFGGLKCSHKQ